MTKLNQLIAIEKDVKSMASKAANQFYHSIQRTGSLMGITRNYRPKDEDGEMFSPEKTLVQADVSSLLKHLANSQTRVFDVTLSKDVTNCLAKADVVVDGVTVLEAVPLTYLLFLEKRLLDLHTMFASLPVLDPAQKWTYSETANAYEAEPVETTKSKKVVKVLTLVEATKEHPAQAKEYFEDVVTGYWTKVDFSGALPASRVAVLVERAEALREAVKKAREEANSIEVSDRKAGQKVFDFLLAP